jgi:hypothetical protein
MVFTKKWFHAALIRAVKTIAQTAVATIGTVVAMGEVNWLLVGSASLLAGILSMLTSIAGLPEAEGAYILTVYFDGMFVLEQDFSVLPSPVAEDPEIQEPAT